LPLTLYDCIYYKRNKTALFYCLPFLTFFICYIATADISRFSIVKYFAQQNHIAPFIFWIVLSAEYGITLLLAYETCIIRDNRKLLIHIKDTHTEDQLYLHNQNKTLLKQQDYEIHIATLNERNRIAREIHDNVGHMLSRSILQIGALIASNKNEELTPFYMNLKDTLNEAMNNIRNSVHDLHDESLNLKEQMERLVHDFTFCPIELDYDISEHTDISVKYCFIAITKEALNNIIKHSNATRVHIRIIEHPAFYQYIIEDNGTKDTPQTSQTQLQTSATHHHGIGLSNMNERVNSLHGTFFYKHTNQGFSIHISIPSNMNVTNSISSF
jgi:signal transduction histidine kinase